MSIQYKGKKGKSGGKGKSNSMTIAFTIAYSGKNPGDGSESGWEFGIPLPGAKLKGSAGEGGNDDKIFRSRVKGT